MFLSSNMYDRIIRHLSGGSVVALLGEEKASLQARCRSIHREWRAHRQVPRGECPAQRAPAVLKERIYVLAHELFERCAEESWQFGVGDVIRVSCDQRIPAEPKGIWLGLLAIIDTGAALNRSERHRYAVELQYARRHRVPVELLSGFIWQVGGAKRISKLSDDRHESWFDETRHTAEAFKRAPIERSTAVCPTDGGSTFLP